MLSPLKRLIAMALVMLQLAGCLTLERVEMSPKDLVQPQGLEGRWFVSMQNLQFDSKPQQKIAQIRAADDGTFMVSVMSADEGNEGTLNFVDLNWSMALITTPEEETFIALIRVGTDPWQLLGILVNGSKLFQGGWVLARLTANEDVSHEEAAKWMKERYGLTYTKGSIGRSIEGVVKARALWDMTVADPKAARYFSRGQAWNMLTRMPKDHPYQARLDKEFAERAHRSSNDGETKATTRQTAERGERENQESDEIKNLRKAAEAGDARAQNNLGVFYSRGQGVPKDDNKAAAWVAKAAQQGYTLAERNLGVFYYNGQVVPKDYKRAAEYFGLAAGQGDVEAQYYLATLYLYGQGVLQSPQVAERLLHAAAEKNHAQSQLLLGSLYLDGKQLRHDPQLARRFLQAAANQGEEKAADMLAALDRQQAQQSQQEELSPGKIIAGILLGALALGVLGSVAGEPREQITATESAPRCGTEYRISPSRTPCGSEWRPWGKWKAKYWCYTDSNWEGSYGSSGITFCTNGHGTWQRSGLLDPCAGVEGWCKGGLLE